MTADNQPSSIEKCILDIAECPICNEVLKDNRCLPCLHMFCLKCIASYRKGKPKGKKLPCPVCRREFSIPKPIEDLPRNFFIDKLLDAHKVKPQNALPKICEICSEESCHSQDARSMALKGNDSVLATRFCCDCRQFMCLFCEKQHKKIKAIMWHKIIDSTSVPDSQDLAPKPTYCIAHKTKEAEVYCQDCKMVICWQCKAVSHNNHVSLDVSSATKDLSAKLEEHIELISRHLHTKQAHFQKLKEREKSYTDEIDIDLANISRVERKLHRNITDNADKLKTARSTSARVHLDAFKELREKLKADVNELTKHKVYIEQMINLGNVSDLCEYTDKLILKTSALAQETTSEINVPSVTHLSDSELQALLTGNRPHLEQNAYINDDDNSCLKHDIPPIDDLKRIIQDHFPIWDIDDTYKSNDNSNDSQDQPISSSPTTDQQTGITANDLAEDEPDEPNESEDVGAPNQTVVTASPSKLLNNIQNTQVARSLPGEDLATHKDWSLIRTIKSENDRNVCGITVLDSMLYVVSQDSNNISVYSATELLFLKNIKVDKLVNPNDAVSCKFSNCLYIYDWGTARIFRVKVKADTDQMNWKTDRDIGCLSVTNNHTILVAGYVSSKLKEYTSNGELMHSIKLRSDVKPWHAIKLDCGGTHYLICQGDIYSTYHRVCLIGLDGEVKNVFGGVTGSDESHLCGPYHLAVDENGCILVNDCNNSRILLLSQDLKFIKEIIPSSSKVLRRARRTHLDEAAGRLYVADNAGPDSEVKDGKILVFSNSGGTLL